ncbi:Tetratricopeptide domain protein [uncultured delta proteobacterium]|uniref:Tetratricopeptide domain protein n=1 Tax=uncultured delta proteobacterium TaxID=34034 RepID=A0A212J446_9DELT|nr:Tetratricopeptide domain protein [uncultured delta proteobacterium]
MAFLRALQSLFRKQAPPVRPGEGERPAYRDTLSVINDLSRLVRNDPEAVDIYLALGNLFRAQGDIERAVLIREGLIARPSLNTQFKARAYFELGQDYYRAGVVDRALAAFREAARLGYSQSAVTAELADLFAYAGDFEKAADEYGRLKHYLAQAHYLVRQAREFFDTGDTAKTEKLLKRALKLYPSSVEAWNESIRMAILAKSARKAGALLERALDRVAPHLRFLLLDALLETLAEPAAPSLTTSEADGGTARPDPAPFVREVCEAVIPILEKQDPHILIHYYGALLLQRAGDADNVDVWLAKALVVQPHFWAARLQSLALSVQKHELPPVVGMQVTYLADELKHISRFVCTVCGFREKRVFYRCRRCGSWHSLAFRLSLQQ